MYGVGKIDVYFDHSFTIVADAFMIQMPSLNVGISLWQKGPATYLGNTHWRTC